MLVRDIAMLLSCSWTILCNSVKKDAHMSTTLWYTIRIFIVWKQSLEMTGYRCLHSHSIPIPCSQIHSQMLVCVALINIVNEQSEKFQVNKHKIKFVLIYKRVTGICMTGKWRTIKKRGGICRTGKWRTKSQGWNLQDWKMTDWKMTD